MADNVILNPGANGDIIAADDINGVKHQRFKVQYGSDGTAIDVDTPTPLPVILANDLFLGDNLRVSIIKEIFNSDFRYSKQNLKWESSAVTPVGTPMEFFFKHIPEAAAVGIGALRANGGSTPAVRQTRQYFKQRPGSFMRAYMGFQDNTNGASTDSLVGMFDDENGVFIRRFSQTQINIVSRSSVGGSVVDTAIAQSSWNLDPMDGTGPSGAVLDTTKLTVLVIEVGRSNFGDMRLGFGVGGGIVYVHRFDGANTLATPLSSATYLPIRYELRATAPVSGQDILRQYWSSIISDAGGLDEVGTPFSVWGKGYTPEAIEGSPSGATADDVYPLLSLRPKRLFGGVKNRVIIRPASLELGSHTDGAVQWALILGGRITSPTDGPAMGPYVSVHEDSAVEAASRHPDLDNEGLGKRNPIIGGWPILTGFLASKDVTGTIRATQDLRGLLRNVFVGLNNAGMQDTELTVGMSGGGGKSRVAFRWEEL